MLNVKAIKTLSRVTFTGTGSIRVKSLWGAGGRKKLYEPTHTASENLKKLLLKWSHNPTGDRQLTWSQTTKSVMTCKRSIGHSQTPLTEH